MKRQRFPVTACAHCTSGDEGTHKQFLPRHKRGASPFRKPTLLSRLQHFAPFDILAAQQGHRGDRN